MLSEVVRTISKSKKNTSPGSDNLPIEILQAAGKPLAEILHKLICTIWKTGKWPTDWCKSVYIPIPKKGDLLQCSNYRTIALISHASKILLIIVAERMKGYLDSEIAPEQAGFRTGRGTRDQLFNIR